MWLRQYWQKGFRNICFENPIYSKLKRSDQSQDK